MKSIYRGSLPPKNKTSHSFTIFFRPSKSDSYEGEASFMVSIQDANDPFFNQIVQTIFRLKRRIEPKIDIGN